MSLPIKQLAGLAIGLAKNLVPDAIDAATLRLNPTSETDPETEKTTVAWGAELSVELLGYNDENERKNFNDPTVTLRTFALATQKIPEPISTGLTLSAAGPITDIAGDPLDTPIEMEQTDDVQGRMAFATAPGASITWDVTWQPLPGRWIAVAYDGRHIPIRTSFWSNAYDGEDPRDAPEAWVPDSTNGGEIQIDPTAVDPLIPDQRGEIIVAGIRWEIYRAELDPAKALALFFARR